MSDTMSLWEFEQHPIGKALTDLRLRGATDFKDPQHQGQRGCDWDAGLLAACEVVRQALPTGAKQKADVKALRDRVQRARDTAGTHFTTLKNDTADRVIAALSKPTPVEAGLRELTDKQILEIASNPICSPCSPWWLKDDVLLGDVQQAALIFARAILAALSETQPPRETSTHTGERAPS